MNKFWKNNHLKNLAIIILGSILLLTIIDGAWNLELFKSLLKEFIIVMLAAFVVSSYFEFYLRGEISDEFNKIIEMKEEFGKAGIVKYFPSYRDVDVRNYLKQDVKIVEIYVSYGNTFFKHLED